MSTYDPLMTPTKGPPPAPEDELRSIAAEIDNLKAQHRAALNALYERRAAQIGKLRRMRWKLAEIGAVLGVSVETARVMGMLGARRKPRT